MRRISFALTERQFLDGSKTVTRRNGWATLGPGVKLRAVRKGMGLKKGERQVVLGDIEVVSVRREPLNAITWEDCAREGFPHLTPAGFVEFYCKHNACSPETIVTRIAFRRLDG